MSADEQVHPFDPAVWSWNESWYFSWIDLDGGPAGSSASACSPTRSVR